jgi:hypothetical protein
MKAFIRVHSWFLLSFIILLPLSGCKVSQMESTARTMNRDLDLVRSPYQYKVSEDETKLLRVLRKMPVGETAAGPVLRADIEKSIERKIGAAPKITEIRVFETHPEFRREVWVTERDGKQFAFDIYLRPSLRGGVNSTIEGPIEIHGNLE